jgi:acyl-CoA synthetase (AMP-forming)/AMP-acid ligase II/acetyltransferase-like isoleucine patch superfamily enzyme
LIISSPESLAQHRPTDRRPLTPPDFSETPLLFQQSSGTTGIRKGMLLTESMVMSQLESYNKVLNLEPSRDVIVSWLPLYHDMGLVGCLLQSVYWGLPLVLTSPFVWLDSPKWLFEAIERHAGTVAYLPNFAFNVLTQRLNTADFGNHTLSSLRLLVSCSEPVVASSVKAFRKKFAEIGLSPNAVSSSYAMAENTFAVTQSEPGRGIVLETIDKTALEITGEAIAREKGIEVASSGKPIPGVRVQVRLDRTSCPDGVCGEIHVKSQCRIDSYFGVGENVEVVDRDGWLSTGDLGYLRKGELFVVGRKKDMIIRAGRNLIPTDIEEAAGKVPEVKAGRVVAFGVFNEHQGTEDVVIVAEFGGERYSDIDQIKIEISTQISRALDVAPQAVAVVRPNWLVKSSSGKISRAACKEKFLQLRKKQQISRILVTEYSGLTEDAKDCFQYFGRDSKIKTPTTITAPGRIKLGNWVSLGMYGKILMQTDFSTVKRYALQHFPEVAHDYNEKIYGERDPHLKIGDCTMIGDFFFISCALSIEIGKHVVISDRVFITDSNHLYENPEMPIALQSNSLGTPVSIGDGSWIGINAVILEGARIGKHAVISANTVVAQDVPDYAVFGGNPGRILRFIGANAATETQVFRADTETTSNIEDTIRRILASEFQIEVSVHDSLFCSGLIDSLGTLRFLESMESLMGCKFNEILFFETQPDTIHEIAAFINSHC